MKLKEFAGLVYGTVVGDPETPVTGVAGISSAGAGDITFLASPKYAKYLEGCSAACIIVKDKIEGIKNAQLVVDNPLYTFAKALEIFYPRPVVKPGIDPDAFVSDKASVSAGASVLAFAFISGHVTVGEGTVISQSVFIGENTRIGRGCIIYPNVTIRENVVIGDRVIIHPGSVIGSDGFGYVFEKGEHYKIPQIGGVIIGDDVEIGSNVTVDRATTGNTVISRGTKIDNLVQVAHNVTIGERSIIIAQTAIGGSSVIGSFVSMGGQVAISDHSTIESGTMIVSQSGLAGKVTKGVYAGSPAIPHKTWLRAQALYGRLPDMNRKIRELEERLNKLEKGKVEP